MPRSELADFERIHHPRSGGFHSCLIIVRGDLDLAEKQATEALRLALDGGVADAQAGYDEQLGILRWHQGRLGEVLPRLRITNAQLPAIPTRWAGLVLAEAISGDRERAKTLLRAVADDGFELFYGPPWLGCMCQWAAVAAEQHFADAWRIHQQMRAPFYTAETGLHWGRFLLSHDPKRARPLLNEALDLARRYGFGAVERDATATLASALLRPLSGAGSLGLVSAGRPEHDMARGGHTEAWTE
jgi:hypothetical protein